MPLIFALILLLLDWAFDTWICCRAEADEEDESETDQDPEMGRTRQQRIPMADLEMMAHLDHRTHRNIMRNMNARERDHVNEHNILSANQNNDDDDVIMDTDMDTDSDSQHSLHPVMIDVEAGFPRLPVPVPMPISLHALAAATSAAMQQPAPPRALDISSARA